MNRKTRRNRRRGLTGRISGRIGVNRWRGERRGSHSEGSSPLFLEELETRTLLTTLVLPAGSLDELVFYYEDPQKYEPGDDPSGNPDNILTIGTLSGLAPEKDITVEILDYMGQDIPGEIYSGSQLVQRVGGGQGGYYIIHEVPPNTLGGLVYSVNALATNPEGETYGITDTGLLIKVDTRWGTVDKVIGQIADRDHPSLADIEFTDVDAAAFDPITGELYAVVNGPTEFTATHEIASTGEVFIRIDLSDDDGDGIEEVSDSDGIVEVEAAGRNPFGQADYSYSVVDLPGAVSMDILTIAYMETATRSSLTEPIFLAFNNEGYEAPKEFLTISLVETPATPANAMQVTTTLLVSSPDEELAQGLMYDNQLRLWALWNEEPDPEDPEEFPPTDGELKEVFLDPDSERFSDNGIEYPEYPDPYQPSELKSYLTGMTFDRQSNIGYATDPVTGTLYQINISGVELVEDEYVNTRYADIYMMYIASSTPDAYISIVHEAGATSGEPALLFIDEDNSEIITPDDAGGVMIGTIPQILPGDDEIHWTPGSLSDMGTFFDTTEVVPDPGLHGVYPGGAFRPGILLPGDEYGIPQHIGKITICGGVFGDVVLNGSIDTFYAGYLGTNRFLVDGDIHNLAVGTQSGGIEESDGSWTQAGSSKYGGDGFAPVVEVQGAVNSIYSNDDWGMPVLVHGRSDVPHFPGIRDYTSEQYVDVQREIEKYSYLVESGGLGYVIPGVGFESLIRTNEPNEAQFVGSIDGTVSLVGEVEGPGPLPDLVDYYSFAVMAGQPIELQLYYTQGTGVSGAGDPLMPASDVVLGAGLALYDPDLVLVASLGEVDIVTGAPLDLNYTPDRAGIYTVAVTASLYRLEIEGLAPTTLGGMNVLTDTRTSVELIGDERPLVQVLHGDMGGMNIGEIMRGGQIRVDDGDLPGIRSGFAGETTVGFNWEIGDTGGMVAFPNAAVSVAGRIGEVHSPVSSVVNIQAGGDIQSVRIGRISAGDDAIVANYAGTIVANQNIGSIEITGDIDLNGEGWDGVFYFTTVSGIFANADAKGDPGIIERIYVGGDLGGFGVDIPISVGPLGGNVRFVDIEGDMFYTNAGWRDMGGFGPFTFGPGQSVTITDDSGVQVKVSPGFTTADIEETYFDPTAEPDPDEEAPVDGVLSIKLVPIWDLSYEDYVGGLPSRTLLGYAISQIDSTDGLRVTSKGGPVDLGTITVAGVEDNQVVFSGNDPIHILEINVSGVISQIKNTTPGGDIVSIIIPSGTGTPADDQTDGGLPDEEEPDETDPDALEPDVFPLSEQPFDLIRVDGHLGKTYSVTGQCVETVEFAAAEESSEEESPEEEPTDEGSLLNPIGSQTTGVFSEVGINRIVVTGSLGDVNITGDVMRIVLNEDKSQGVGQFDGVAGAIVIDGNLDRIELGDGVFDPGTGTYAASGVFVTGELNHAEITGAGHDINGPIYSSTEIHHIVVSDGARIVGFNGQGGTGERVRGSFSIAFTISTTAEFDDFQLTNNFTLSPPGGINLIEVKGNGSAICQAHIHALSIDEIRVTGGAEGIFDSRIYAATDDDIINGQLGKIIVGGVGIHNTVIAADRNLDRIIVQPGGTLEDSEIRGLMHIGSVIADEINRTDIDAVNELEKVTARHGIFDLAIEAGELGTLKVKDDILGSSIQVAGPVKLIQAKGDIISTIEVTGPYGNLKKLKAGGDIGTPVGGEIIVDGQVGTIQAGGDFQADLLLNWVPDPVGPGNPQGPHKKFDHDGVELGKLKAGGKIIGLMDIGGDVKAIQSGDEFGVFGSHLGVHGNLNKLVVGSGKNASDLESSIFVDENLGTVKVYGSTNGQFDVVEDFKSLTLKGVGYDRANLNASITVGGDFDTLTIINGDISKTDVVEGGLLVIDVAGEGPNIKVKGSDVNGIAYGSELNIDGSITSTGRFISTADAGTLRIGGDIEAGGIVDIRGDLDALVVEGTIYGTVRVSGNVGSIEATDILGTESIVTAGGDINVIKVSRLMQDTYVLAGFDTGDIVDDEGNVLLTRTEQLVTGVAGQGDIGTAKVDTLDNSVIAAGVSPGTNTIFGDLDGSDNPGAGLSTIGTVVIEDTDGEGDPFGVFADSDIKRLVMAGKKVPTPTFQSDGFGAWTIAEESQGSIGGFPFESGHNFTAAIDGVLVTVSMKGPGTGEVLPGATQIDTIFLKDTTQKTKIKVTAAGASTINVGALYNYDDNPLKQLSIDGYLANAENDAVLSIGGSVGKIQLEGVGPGSTITIGGNASKVDLGDLAGTAADPSSMVFYGDVKQMQLDSVSSDVSITADNINKVSVRRDMDGHLNCVDSFLGTAMVRGDMGGVINSAGDIHKVVVQGTTGGTYPREIQGIRAGGNIGTFITAEMDMSVAAAGENFSTARIQGDVTYSTLAAGLDIGPGGILFDYYQTNEEDADRDTAGRGDLETILIQGDFTGSNIVAALAPGQDNTFGTGDDQLEHRSIEEVDAPQVANVFFDTTDLTEIHIQFKRDLQDRSGNIKKVEIQGDAIGSISPADQYLIGAAGEVESVWVHRQVFEGEGNVLRKEINYKDIEASTLEIGQVTPDNAATNAIVVRTDGLDHIFGTADDVIVSGDPLMAPTVWVEFDTETNTAIFHNENGFTVNPWSTNYYQILLDGDQITNKQGIPLDGEYNAVWPSGDGLPGGDFEYYFAVADLGDTLATAFSPFAHSFPENLEWAYKSGTGDNPQWTGEDVLDEMDFVRLNDLKEGQILNIQLREDTGIGWESFSWSEDSSTYIIQLWQVVDENVVSTEVPVYGLSGLPDISDNPVVTVPAVLVVPELDELAFAGEVLYGYDNIGHQFYTIDSTTTDNAERLDNTLNDLSNLVGSTATILDLKALTGHAEDSLWAIADVLPNTGTPRESLVLIKKLSFDVNSIDPDLRAEVTLANYDLGDIYTDIVGLEEYNGVLYGIDAESRTLFTIDSNPFSATFGQPSSVGDGVGNLGVEDLCVAGLSQAPDGNGLIVLHDQPANFFENFLVDATYRVDPTTGQATVLQEFRTDAERHGLATSPGGSVWVGQPLRNTPLGDTVEIQFGNLDPVKHVFGQDISDFSGGNVVTSDSSVVPLNLYGQEFIDAGYYYAFDIEYAHGFGYGDVTVEITDIDWLNDTNTGTIIAATSDDAANVTLFAVPELDGGAGLEILIDADNGDGDVRVFFAATSYVELLESSELMYAGEVLGEGTRTDLNPQRDTLIPQLSEYAINSGWSLYSENHLELDANLEAQLENVLGPDLIREELTDDEIDEIAAILIGEGEDELLANFYAAITTVLYDAVAYDASLDSFMLVSTYTYEARPLMVDPSSSSPTTETDDDVVLTSEVLSDLYTQVNPGYNYTFSDIRGLEFGEITYLVDPLYMVVTVTISNPLTDQVIRTQDSLLRIDNILDPTTPWDPTTGMRLSVHNLDFLGFEDVRPIAYGNIQGSDANNGWIYGIDSATQTLLRIDPRTRVGNASNTSVMNPDFGKAFAIGGQMNNLGDPGQSSYDIQSIDFGADGKLYAIENTTHSIVQLFTNPTSVQGSSRIELVMDLPGEDVFSQIDFDTGWLGTAGLLSRPVTGSPLGDTVQVQINGETPLDHVFGGLSTTTIGDVSIDSSTGNDSASVSAEGGYYRFDVTYDTNQGDLELTINDIHWLGGTGDIDSVFVTDSLNTMVQRFGENALTVLIHTDHTVQGGGSEDSVTIYFGATSDFLLPTTGQQDLELVESYDGFGHIDAPIEIPEDGDYVVQVTSDLYSSYFDPGSQWIGIPNNYFYGYLFLLPGAEAPLSNYEIRLEVFNDGNSDFGVSETSNYLYDPVFPDNSPVNLEPTSWGNTDLVPDEDDPDLYTYNPATSSDGRLAWPITVEGTLMEPGQASEVTINADLGNLFDVDVFSFRLEEGQRVTVDLDAEVLFGNDILTDIEGPTVSVAIYNGDLETITSIHDQADDVLATTAAQQADSLYQAQAIFTMPNHEAIVIDPEVSGYGTYYIVVTGYAAKAEVGNTAFDVYGNDPIPYQLTIETTEVESIETPPSQLVWLAFEGAQADYLLDEQGGWGSTPDVVNRPAFDAGAYDLENMRTSLINAIAARIGEIYRNTGLDVVVGEIGQEFSDLNITSETEMALVIEEPPVGTLYSTVVFGGTLQNFYGLAQMIDRHNEERCDMAVVLTDGIAAGYRSVMSNEMLVRFEETVNAIANTGAHELGHLLGLEHATEINTNNPANIIGYNFAMELEEQEFKERDSFRLFAAQQGYGILDRQIGFENEIDMLLRYIGSDTPIGV